MDVSTDSGPSAEQAVAVSEPSPTNTTGSNIATPANADDPASSITVNTKAPPVNFPPPKTDKPRPHVCQTCQRSFARLEHLKRHERSHTKEKPFECPECTRCFARRDLLLRHQQKLHQTTTPSSRPRNRRESTSGAMPAGSRARKNSVASTSIAGGALAGGVGQMRPRANTISHVDGAAISMIAAANVSVARGIPQGQPHSRHASLVGLAMHGHGHGHGLDHQYAGMASAMGQRGMSHALPKIDTVGMHGFDPSFGTGLRTAPLRAAPTHFGEFDFEGFLFSAQGSTINPNALHYNDSPQSMAPDVTSPFSPHCAHDMGSSHMDDAFDWLTGFDQQMSFHNNPPENAVDGSSPSAISTTSQSGISDVMLDGSMMEGVTHQPTVTSSMASSTFFAQSMMGPPHMGNPYALDMGGSIFPDLMNGAPVSPQPPTPQSQHQPQQHKGSNAESFFSTPPPSLSSLSPSVLSALGGQNLNHALNYAGTGPETPSSMNGITTHGTSPVSTITDSTRSAILGALARAAPQYPFGGRKYSFGASSHPPPALGGKQTTTTGSPLDQQLPSTQDLQRYVGAYLRCFHPHLPFLHVPTLSFEISATAVAGNGATNPVDGIGCLTLSMAAVGALYEKERDQSGNLFEMAKKLIQLYLDERRKAIVRKADFNRLPALNSSGQSAEGTVETPLWLVQAMLLNVVYGHNCGEKRAGEIASTHAAALVSLAQGAELMRPVRMEASEMEGVEGSWTDGDTVHPAGAEAHAEWLRWAAMEERKRTLFAIFILSSMLVTAYNQTPALTNSEIMLDLPCDEDFFAAENAAAFQAKGGIAVANRNRMRFHEALGELLSAHQKPRFQAALNTRHLSFGAAVELGQMPESDLKPSTMGLLILINALHNYVWETRQRHQNKVWTNEETEKLHRHIEPALRAWQAAWASDPQCSLGRPNPFGAGPLSADCVPLMDLAYVRLFVNMARTKERFWQRDWAGLADELARGSEIIQHAEHSPASNAESALTDPSESGSSSVFIDSPPTQSSSPEFAAAKFPPSASASGAAAGNGNALVAPGHGSANAGASTSRITSRREKHLRRAAFYAADSLSMQGKLGVTYADFTRDELPLQSAICVFDCSQVLAEWAATLQDRVGRYLGVLGQDDVDLGQVPAIMLLEEEDVKLLCKVQELLADTGSKTSLDASAAGGSTVEDLAGGYGPRLLRSMAHILGKAAVWPVTNLMVTCLEHHAGNLRVRAEKSVVTCD